MHARASGQPWRMGPSKYDGSLETVPYTVPLFLFSYFSAVRLVDTLHGLCLSLFAKVTITATLVPFTDHGLDATNVGWPYDGPTPVDAQEHRCTASPLQKKAAASRLIAPTAQ